MLQLIAAGGVAVTGTPQTFALTATSPGCSAGGTGTTCTISIAAPVGLDVFTAETFASTTGNGTLLSTGAFQVNVQQNATNAAAISLNGTVASLYLASVNGTLGVLSTDKTRRASVQSTRSAQGTGTAATQSRIYIIALDSNNNIILNPTIFNTPITLQLSFEYGYNPDVTLSDTPISGTATSTSSNFGTVTVTSPSDVVTATLLNGATNPSSYAYIAGYLNGAPPAPAASAYYSAPSTSVPQVVLQVNASSGPLTATYNPWSLSGSYSYNYLSGGSGDYTYSIGTSTCSGIATLYIGYGYELVAQPLSAGSCSVTITDESSDSITIPITVTSIAVTGS